MLVLQVSETLSIFVTWMEGWLLLAEEPVAVWELELAALASVPPAFELFALPMLPVTRTSCPIWEFSFELSALAGSCRS